MRELARLCGYGNNPSRLRNLCQAKRQAETISELLVKDVVAGKFKERCDKLTGDPIWTQAWHHFMALKKGQSFRCQIVKTKRVKDVVSNKWVWQTKWARHQKRYMSMKMSEFHSKVLKWEPYLKWRADFVLKNPRFQSWHVGISRLYKEKCFCIDEMEQVRKCGCEYHLKMGELITGLKRWRRTVQGAVQLADPGHMCEV